MQRLICTARNISHMIADDQVIPDIEAVFSMAEKHMEYLAGGLVANERISTVRFMVSPETARKLASTFIEWADNAEEEAKRLRLSPNENPKSA